MPVPRYKDVIEITINAIVGASWCADDLKFPPGFKFGAASSAYQVEGAWNVSETFWVASVSAFNGEDVTDQVAFTPVVVLPARMTSVICPFFTMFDFLVYMDYKGENIWDRFIHQYPSRIAGGSNGDVACDSYHLWRRDVEMASELGLHFYRFSISWSRLLPHGFANYISEDGKNYYNNLIDALLEEGIEPLVTLYHVDLPQVLEDLGGWSNPLIADWFADYARVVYSLFADRVKTWITVNEPLAMCDGGYDSIIAPYYDSPNVGVYLCTKYVLIAHAKAWRIYDEEYKPKYHGIMTLTNLFFWFEPITDDDRELTELVLEYTESRFSYPIYSKQGGWPQKLERVLAENSKKLGFPRFRLPPFTQEEIELVKGTYDYYALNHYTTYQVRKPKEGETIGRWPFDGLPELGAVLIHNPEWKKAAPYWFSIYPEGLRHQLSWVKEQYGDLRVIITENGYASDDPTLQDSERLAYIKDNLAQVLLAIKEDGINVTGYTVWTLMDNFEWMAGYMYVEGLIIANNVLKAYKRKWTGNTRFLLFPEKMW